MLCVEQEDLEKKSFLEEDQEDQEDQVLDQGLDQDQDQDQEVVLLVHQEKWRNF